MFQSNSKRLHNSDDSDDETNPKKKPNLFRDKCNAYQASGIKRSLHGTIYQLKMLIVFVVRALKNNYKFRLASEMNAAGKFDDLVFQYQSGNSIVNRFLQAKHKQDDSTLISFNDLINQRNDEFSLQKYFISYRSIKRNALEFEGDLSDFILCTNIDLDYKDLEANGVKVEKISTKDEFLFSDGSSMKWKLCVDVKHDLSERMRECSAIHLLARALVSHIKDSQTLTLRTDDFKLYHRALVNESVIDIENEKFHDKFINSDPTLSESARTLREILENYFRKIDGLTIENAKLKFAPSFGIGFELNSNPQIQHPVIDFAIQLAELIVNTTRGGSNTVTIERRKRVIKTNINQLAGYVIVEKENKNVFSTKFLDINSKLAAGNLDEFRNDFKNHLEKNNFIFTSLDQLTLVVSNFQSCEEGKHDDRPVPLPLDKIEDDEIKEFFDKLIFAVNQPNEIELTKIIEREMGEYPDFNLLDASLVSDSFEIQILDWFKMKTGTWITNENANEYLKRLQQKTVALMSAGCNSYIEMLQAFEMSYEKENETLKQFLTDDNSGLNILNFISAEDTLFGAIKVFQTVNFMSAFKQLDSYIFIRLTTLSLPETRKRILTAFTSSKSIRLLIIECNGKTDVEIDQLGNDILTANASSKKLILISQENQHKSVHPLAMKFPKKLNVHDRLLSFKNFTSLSREKILKISISFQGNDLELKQILSDDVSTQDALLDSNTLVRLLRNHKIAVGRELPIFNDYNQLNYIERTFYNLPGGVRKVSNTSFVSDRVENDYSKKPLPHELFRESSGTFVRQIILSDKEFVKRQYSVAALSDLILLSDDAGMGKSTIFYRLYELIKNFIPNHLIFLIRLNNCTRILRKEVEIPRKHDRSSASDLLLKLIQSDDNSYTDFEEKFIRTSLSDTNKRITLMFDGFDEICPDFESSIVDLVNELRKTEISKLWLSTRSIMKDTLEKEFKVTAVALQPFTGEDQIRFLNKNLSDYALSQNQICEQSYTETYAKALIKKFVVSIKDNRMKFTGSPLQLKMLASVFKQSFSKYLQKCNEDIPITTAPIFPAKLKLHELYENFITEKCQIFSKEKGTELTGNVAANAAQKHYLKHTLVSHEELAFQELFLDDKIDRLRFQTDDDILLSIEKIGIVQKINGNFHFVHSTFAEYLVAKYLANKLGETPRRIDKDALQFLFEEILLQPYNEGVRTFFDGILNGMPVPENVLRNCGEIFSKILHVCPDYSTKSPLHAACLENNISIIYFMVNSLAAADKSQLLKSLIEAPNNSGETLLLKAAEMCDLDLIKFLKTIGQADPESVDNHGSTVLSKSVTLGLPFDVIELLGGNENAVNDDNESVLFKAAEMGNLRVVEFLVSNSARVDFVSDGITVLHHAIHSGNLDVVRCLVANEANVDAVDGDGNSVLHYAAYSGYLEICKWLVDKNGGRCSKVRCKSDDGSSILHEAAISGNLDLCQWLVDDVGLSIECVDENGRTALHDACKYNNSAVAKWLVDFKGASINSVDNEGHTLLMEAAKYGDSNLCEWLIGESLNASVVDRNGRTMLKIAIEYGNLDVLQWLTSYKNYKSDIEIREITAEYLLLPLLSATANHEMKWALKKNSITSQRLYPDGILRYQGLQHRADDIEDIVLHLIENGADINARSNSGQTIIHCAISKGHIYLVKRLLEMKGEHIDFTLPDENCKTALDLAIENEEHGLAYLLEKLQVK